MSDLQVCSAPNDNGVVLRGDRLCSSTSLFQSFPVVSNSNSISISISRENWEIAERRTDEILCRIRPTVVADKKRREVINYVHHLITASLGCEVFPYGSVPLKTYLPDGDIDLTAISNPNIEESLVSDVHAVLRGEELNKSCHFQVKDVHCIDAEVKLVKCLVENIVVDISFNQLGGLCTLCFLEKVDGLVGKGHLFKRSIILIKAWCYYESRILGAHHGLISTYALETLVLCIFHLFHSSLDGPLAVLCRFLDYFSKFDWENYCVSLNGPVCKSSLSDIAATKVSESRVDNMLLSEEFLQECVDKFSVPSRAIDTNSQAFPQKHLNIIDALKGNNNLGRSVNRGNFYRICSAFKYGAHKLGQILMLPCERLADELNKFFANTLERHESQHWTDFLDFAGSVDHSSSTQDFETCSQDDVFLNPSPLGYSNKIARFRNNQKRNLLKVTSSPYQKKVVSYQAVPDIISDGNAISERHLAGNVKEVVLIGILSSRSRNDSSVSLPLNIDIGTSLCGKSKCVPPHCSGKIDNGNPCGRTASKSLHDYDTSFALWPDSKENSLLASSSVHSCGNHESILPKNISVSTSILKISERSSSVCRERSSASTSRTSEPSKSLLDLSGHYESYFSSLIYGKHYYFSAPALLSPTSYQLQNKNLWKAIWQSLQFESQVYSKTNRSGGWGHQFCPVNSSMSSNPAFSSDEKKKPRGLGTYFPKMNHVSNRDRPLSGRKSCQGRGTHGQLQRYTKTNGLISAPTETNLCGEGSYELPQEDYPVLGNGKSSFLDSYRQHPSGWGSPNASDLSLPLERCESGSHGHQLRDVPLPEVSTQPASDTSYRFDSVSSLVVPVAQGPDLAVESNQERVTEQSYHLKNEVDFPPLSH